MGFKLDVTSLSSFLPPECNQVLIYGFQKCHYDSVYLALKKHSKESESIVKKAFDYKVGVNPPRSDHRATTLEGRKITQIVYDGKHKKQRCNRRFKAGLVNIVLENYKRAKENLPLIPILFLIDIAGSKHPFTPQSLCSRENKINKRYTHKELRRMYKMCFSTDPLLKKFAEVARESLVFVKPIETNQVFEEEVTTLAPGATSTMITRLKEYRLETVNLAWNNDTWTKAWQERISTKTTSVKPNDWRVQVKRFIKEYEATTPEPNFL